MLQALVLGSLGLGAGVLGGVIGFGIARKEIFIADGASDVDFGLIYPSHVFLKPTLELANFYLLT